MIETALARAVHVVAVIIWIGGVGLATTAVLPLVRDRSKPLAERFAMLAAIERRFIWQARIATLLVALSGFYMVAEFDLWHRFQMASYWWMHAMVLVWLVFTLMLFVAQPFIFHRVVKRRVRAGDESVLRLLHAMHWVLLAASLVTAFAAVAGSHGLTF